MKVVVAQALLNSHSYAKYRSIVTETLALGEVTGKVQTEDLLQYTELNEARMNRLDKKIVITEDNIQKLLHLKKHYIWLVLAEGWCGDAAQLLPIMNKMVTFSKHIDFKIVFRDENEALMNQFLTNESQAIPKLIVLETSAEKVLGSWGPRPKGATQLIKSYKQQYGVIDETAKKELQLWYLHDKGISTQNEIVELMLQCEQLNLQTR